MQKAVDYLNPFCYNKHMKISSEMRIQMSIKDLRAEVSDGKQLEQALLYDKFRFIYAPMKLLLSDTAHKDRIIAVPPVFLGDCEDRVGEKLKRLKAWGYKHALAHTVGHIPLIEGAGMIFHGGARLNITNTESANFFVGQGAEDIILSFELTVGRINGISCSVSKGVIAYGRLPLMITRRCPINNGKPCENNNKCGKTLTDRQGKTIKVLCDNTVELLNPDVLTIADKLDDFLSVDFFVLRFTDEKDILSAAEKFQKGVIPEKGFTRGLYYRGVE